MRKKKCTFCRKLFEWRAFDKITCSPCCAKLRKIELKNIYKYNLEQNDKNKRICNYCKKEFFSLHKKKYCSRKCQPTFRKENARKESICKTCKCKFSKVANNQIYCSEECRPSPSLAAYRIFERDDFRCIYCGKSSYRDKIKLTIDHIEARNNGGTNRFDNITTACWDCNSSKSNRKLTNEIKAKIYEVIKQRNHKHGIKDSQLYK